MNTLICRGAELFVSWSSHVSENTHMLKNQFCAVKLWDLIHPACFSSPVNSLTIKAEHCRPVICVHVVLKSRRNEELAAPAGWKYGGLTLGCVLLFASRLGTYLSCSLDIFYLSACLFTHTHLPPPPSPCVCGSVWDIDKYWLSYRIS